jgi:hypothetical protein
MTKLFRDRAAFLRGENRRHTADFTPISLEGQPAPPGCIATWRSNRFLVQLFHALDGAQRISICRTMIDTDTGRWVDGITWEEIQAIKREVGFGDRMAVEIYPADGDVVNVANMRHIWLVDPLPFAWGRP